MQSFANPPLSSLRVGLGLGMLVLLTAAYFHGGAASNQNARLDAIFAFVEPGPSRGTFQIDRFMVAPERNINTADWAHYGGHYYANKAPLTIVLGAIVYAGLYGLERTLGLDPALAPMQLWNSYAINLALGACMLGIAACVLYLLLCRSVSPPSAAALSFVSCVGTGLLPYSTQLWGHSTAACFVLFGMYALRRGACFDGAARREAFWGGLWLCAAMATDYLACLASGPLLVARLWQRPKDLPWIALGALLPAAIVLGYQYSCFGSPFTLATTYSNPTYLDPSRALGMFALPDPTALLQLTLMPYRGVFLQMPWLLLTLLGFVHWTRRSRRDPWLWACSASCGLGLLSVSSFNGWHGGATVCARYLLPFVPTALIALGEIRWSVWSRRGAWALGLLSAANMLAVAAVNPLCPDAHRNPLYGYTYQMLAAGKLAPYPFPVRLLQYDPEWRELRTWAMWNWGQLLGAKGLWSLAPLALIWLLGALLLIAALRAAEPAAVEARRSFAAAQLYGTDGTDGTKLPRDA